MKAINKIRSAISQLKKAVVPHKTTRIPALVPGTRNNPLYEAPTTAKGGINPLFGLDSISPNRQNTRRAAHTVSPEIKIVARTVEAPAEDLTEGFGDVFKVCGDQRVADLGVSGYARGLKQRNRGIKPKVERFGMSGIALSEKATHEVLKAKIKDVEALDPYAPTAEEKHARDAMMTRIKAKIIEKSTPATVTQG